jgi:hypothetical protein
MIQRRGIFPPATRTVIAFSISRAANSAVACADVL